MVTCRGEAPPSCLRKTVRSLKSPTGAFIAPLRCANASLPRGRQSRLTSPAKKNRAFPMGNALLYISLSYVDLIASFTSSAILNNLFAICNSRLLPTNQIVNCDGRVRPQGAPCFCFAFNFLTHGFRPPACMICYRLVAGSVIFRFLPMQAWQGSHRDGWW